jgi:DNA polymerase sigma
VRAIEPGVEEQARRDQLIQFIITLTRQQWPDARFEIYGSAANKYCLRGADMDVSLFVSEIGAEDMEFSDEEEVGFEYTKGERTKPSEGRFAVKQWQEKQERLKSERQERRAKSVAEEGMRETEEELQPAEDGKDASNNTPEAAAAERKPTEMPVNLAKQNIVMRLGRMLKRADMESVLPLPRARIPIVKFRHPTLRMCCDICINNKLATENTRLLNTYADLDARVRPLCLLVKYWAKQKDINTPRAGTLSSYAYVNLVIYFLQTRKKPVLPVLQQIRPPNQEGATNIIDGFDCYFCDDRSYLQRLGFGRGVNPNKESLGQLLVEFFKFFATNVFNFHDDVVSIRLGRTISKEEKEWTPKSNSRRDRYWWCIEDPFEASHNLGRVADKDSLYTMRGEFIRAYKALLEGRLDEMLEVIPRAATNSTA